MMSVLAVHRRFAHARNQFDGRHLVLAIDHHCVEMLGGQTACRACQVSAMLRRNVQLPQNLAEHLDRFQICTHHQGRKRHTSGMLEFRGKRRQVTSVIR